MAPSLTEKDGEGLVSTTFKKQQVNAPNSTFQFIDDKAGGNKDLLCGATETVPSLCSIQQSGIFVTATLPCH